MNDLPFNIIPIGDHCAISMILQKLKKRQCSYPFDWVAHKESLYDTNIMYNMQIIDTLVTTNDAEKITETYIGDAFQNSNKINSVNNIWFPHDNEAVFDIISKYQRRFERLYTHIFDKNIYILLTRHYFIEPTVFSKMVEQLLGYNSQSVILFISGTDHPYITSEYEGKNVVFKHIPYDITQFYDYDYSDFRPQMQTYLAEFLKTMQL